MKLTKKQAQMAEDNLPLVTHISKRFFSKTDYIKNQDILQEGVLAMLKAIPKYDSEKGKFSTFIYAHLNGHLQRYVYYRDKVIPIPHQKHLKRETLDKADAVKNVFSLDLEYKTKGSGETYTLLHVIPDSKTENIEEDIINKIVLKDAIRDTLEWKERLVITYLYYFDLSQTQIGKLMSMSQAHVHRLEKKALEKIKNYMQS